MDYSFFDSNRIIPVIVINNIEETIPKLTALKQGGIKIAEITFRTAAAEDAIKTASKHFKDMLIGAGTVVNRIQCIKAIEAGAKFIVSPGLSEEVAQICKENDIAYLPGTVTPTEIMHAKNLGFLIVKFFPAEAYGGLKTIKALSAAFPDIKFVPTGGIDQSNFTDYLSQKYIAAIGGSWMMKGSPEEIEMLTSAAVKKLSEVKL